MMEEMLSDTSERNNEKDLLNDVRVSSTIITLISKLNSPGVEERECACSSIANLSGQSNGAQQLLAAHTPKMISPLLSDESITVKLSAVGALRNISVDGGETACRQMVEDDVMPSVCVLIKQILTEQVESVRIDSCMGITEIPVLSDVLYQVICLITNICENSEEAVNLSIERGIPALLLPCLEAAVYGISLARAVALCLQVLTDEIPTKSELHAIDQLDFLMRVLAEQHKNNAELQLRVITAGILCNLGVIYSEKTGQVKRTIFAVLSQCLHSDSDSLVSQLAEAVRRESASQQEESILLSEQTKKIIIDVENILMAKRMTMELLTNICNFDDDDNYEDVDDEDSDSVEDMISQNSEDVAMEADYTDNEGQKEIFKLIEELGLFKKIASEAVLPANPELSCLQSGSETCCLWEKIMENQTFALLCVSNMLSSLPANCLCGPQGLHDLWRSLSCFLSNLAESEKTDKLTAVSSALRAVTTCLSATKSKQLSDVTESDLNFLFNLGLSSQSAEVRADIIRIISAIGCYFALNTDDNNMLKLIGNFLLRFVCSDDEVWVVAEALDSTFDVFAEDETNQVLLELNLIETLKSVMPQLKRKMKNKNIEQKHRPIINTVRTNLKRFVSYKEENTKCPK